MRKREIKKESKTGRKRAKAEQRITENKHTKPFFYERRRPGSFSKPYSIRMSYNKCLTKKIII